MGKRRKNKKWRHVTLKHFLLLFYFLHLFLLFLLFLPIFFPSHLPSLSPLSPFFSFFSCPSFLYLGKQGKGLGKDGWQGGRRGKGGGRGNGEAWGVVKILVVVLKGLSVLRSFIIRLFLSVFLSSVSHIFPLSSYLSIYLSSKTT